ncbi:hypothetical protein BCR34DRAFT_601389 [Clohesyomyces aquaticus]|uniref:Uncharacterized protein n=1 Tax=Clohesyomyces aquaticus TaxID=1231657 RepID=A0A1Y1ZMG6_9PLEO|nr:hypothetical protein BCR34DRAFT_601389 [Clohesyomyces aquaticus]
MFEHDLLQTLSYTVLPAASPKPTKKYGPKVGMTRQSRPGAEAPTNVHKADNSTKPLKFPTEAAALNLVSVRNPPLQLFVQFSLRATFAAALNPNLLFEPPPGLRYLFTRINTTTNFDMLPKQFVESDEFTNPKRAKSETPASKRAAGDRAPSTKRVKNIVGYSDSEDESESEYETASASASAEHTISAPSQAVAATVQDPDTASRQESEESSPNRPSPSPVLAGIEAPSSQARSNNSEPDEDTRRQLEILFEDGVEITNFGRLPTRSESSELYGPNLDALEQKSAGEQKSEAEQSDEDDALEQEMLAGLRNDVKSPPREARVDRRSVASSTALEQAMLAELGADVMNSPESFAAAGLSDPVEIYHSLDDSFPIQEPHRPSAKSDESVIYTGQAPRPPPARLDPFAGAEPALAAALSKSKGSKGKEKATEPEELADELGVSAHPASTNRWAPSGHYVYKHGDAEFGKYVSRTVFESEPCTAQHRYSALDPKDPAYDSAGWVHTKEGESRVPGKRPTYRHSGWNLEAEKMKNLNRMSAFQKYLKWRGNISRPDQKIGRKIILNEGQPEANEAEAGKWQSRIKADLRPFLKTAFKNNHFTFQVEVAGLKFHALGYTKTYYEEIAQLAADFTGNVKITLGENVSILETRAGEFAGFGVDTAVIEKNLRYLRCFVRNLQQEEDRILSEDEADEEAIEGDGDSLFIPERDPQGQTQASTAREGDIPGEKDQAPEEGDG